MQVQSVGLNPGFSGKRDNIKAFINMDDNELMNLSTNIVLNDKELMKKTKKRERLNNALTVALPVAFGLEWAAAAKKGTRLSQFNKAFASSALMLAGIDLTLGVTRLLRKNSEKFKNFSDNHKVLTTLLTLPLAILSGFAAVKGGKALAGKLANTKVFNKLSNKLTTAFSKLKTKGAYTKVSDAMSKLNTKTPSAIKSVAKFGAAYSPLMVVAATLVNSVKNVNGVSNSISKQFISLKDKQLELAKAMNRELSVQNDFLKTDPKNVDDLKMAGMN